MEASVRFQRSWPDGLLPELKGQLPANIRAIRGRLPAPQKQAFVHQSAY
jgi:hypothetical protein